MANTLESPHNGAVGFIDWLDALPVWPVTVTRSRNQIISLFVGYGPYFFLQEIILIYDGNSAQTCRMRTPRSGLVSTTIIIATVWGLAVGSAQADYIVALQLAPDKECP